MKQTMTAHQLPLEASSIAETHHLGLPLQVYQPSLREALMQILAGLGLIVFLLLLELAIYRSHQDDYILTPVEYCGTPFFIIVGLILMFAGLMTMTSRWRGTHERIYECTEGFVVLRGKDRVTDTTRWDEIQTLHHEAKRRHGTYTHTFWIVTRKSTKQDIPYPALWKRIEEEFTQCHLPKALERYHAGKVIHFGELSVSQHGLRLLTDLAWQDISSVRVVADELVIEGAGTPKTTRLSLPLSHTRNTALLEQLLHEISAGCIVCVGLRVT